VLIDQEFDVADAHNLQEEMLEAEEGLSRKKAFLRIQALIRELKPIYQDVIVLRFFENKKIKEIGTILGKKEGTVKSLLSRGLADLQVRFEESSRSQPFDDCYIIRDEGRIHPPYPHSSNA